jgi:hypothetical protein
VIVLFRFYDFKGIIFILIALLSIHIRLKPLRWVILYKVLLYVLHRYVFGAALGFLIRVLRVIGAGCFWLRVLGFDLVLGITVVLVGIFGCMGICYFIF